MDDTKELMLSDFLKEMVILLRDAQGKATHTDSFDDGRRLGLYEALSLFLDMSKEFGISLEALGHRNLHADDFLK